jgi:hypothetical protein
MIQAFAAKHFIDKGLPVNGAVALACVLYFESKLNPGSQGVQSTEHGGVLNRQGAVGIASWNGPEDQSKIGDPVHDRQAALAAHAQKHGLAWNALETQLDFVLNEIANRYPRSWAAIRAGAWTCADIIAVLVAEYENPADHAKEIAGAVEFAGPLLDQVKDYKPVVIAGTPVPEDYKPVVIAGTPTPTGNLQMPIELILQLVAPLAENLVSGLLKGVLAHVQANGIPASPASPVVLHPAVPAPAMPAIDFAQLAQLIAAELAKLQVKP